MGQTGIIAKSYDLKLATRIYLTYKRTQLPRGIPTF